LSRCEGKCKAEDLSTHPLLNVSMCKACVKYYSSEPFDLGEEGYEENCRWCGDGGALVGCNNCVKNFCRECILVNFGEAELKKIVGEEGEGEDTWEVPPDVPEWKCYCCDAAPIQHLQEVCCFFAFGFYGFYGLLGMVLLSLGMDLLLLGMVQLSLGMVLLTLGMV
jgi:hypothetical protein